MGFKGILHNYEAKEMGVIVDFIYNHAPAGTRDLKMGEKVYRIIDARVSVDGVDYLMRFDQFKLLDIEEFALSGDMRLKFTTTGSEFVRYAQFERNEEFIRDFRSLIKPDLVINRQTGVVTYPPEGPLTATDGVKIWKLVPACLPKDPTEAAWERLIKWCMSNIRHHYKIIPMSDEDTGIYLWRSGNEDSGASVHVYQEPHKPLADLINKALDRLEATP